MPINNPYYNLEGLGIRFVASPRHADMLLVTGPVSRNMEVALKRTYAATPEPRLVVAMGDCGLRRWYLRRELCKLRTRFECHPGGCCRPCCPPTPVQLMQGILTAIELRSVD
jgi:Ni,Fe-hydrogenase III small subunit